MSKEDFTSYLQDKLGQHNQEEIQELLLDDFLQTDEFSEDHKKTLEKYESLIHLTLNSTGLKSLKNFPKLEKLQIIELKDNKLTGEDLNILVTQCPELYKIKLDNNQIESIENIKKLKGLKLKKINLEGNPIAEEDNYKTELFKFFDSLLSVDDKNDKDESVESTIYGDEGDEEEEDEEGEEMEDDEEDEGEDFEADEEDDEGGEEEDDEDAEEDDEGDDDNDNKHKKQKH